MKILSTLLLVLDELVEGRIPPLVAESGLDADCQQVVERINQLILRLRDEAQEFRTLFDREPIPVLITSLREGRILYANAKARAEFPLLADLSEGHQAEQLWASPELRRIFVDQVLRESRVTDYQAELRGTTGAPYTALISASRMVFEGADAIMASFVPITARLLAERGLKEALDLNQRLLNASPLGISAYQADTGHCILANPAMESIVGASQEQLLAQNFRKIASWQDCGLLAAAERSLADQATVQLTLEMRTTFGKQIHIHTTFAPFEANSEPHLLMMVKDVTERIAAEQQLNTAHALLEEVGEMARIGGWELDLRDNRLSWSAMVRAIHEVEPGYVPEIATAVNFYAPEAVPVITEAIQSAIQEGRAWDLVLPFVTAKGNRIWVRAIGKPHFEDGKIVKIGGVFQDITARHAANQKMRQLAHAVEQSPASIVITDAQGAIEYANPAAFRLTGFTPEEALGQNPRIFKSNLVEPQLYEDLWTTITAGRDWRGEFHNKKKSGELYWERALISPLRNETGVVTHFIAVKEDITERKNLEAQRESLIASLQEALDNVKTLRTLLPICASCKKIRDEAGYWNQVESYLSVHGDLKFTHGMCPDCAKIYFPKPSDPT